MMNVHGRAIVLTDLTEARMRRTKLLRRIRFWLALFMAGLVLKVIATFDAGPNHSQPAVFCQASELMSITKRYFTSCLSKRSKALLTF